MSSHTKYLPSRLSPVFLDAHILDDCLGDLLPDYLSALPAEAEFVTLDGCVREVRLGYLKHLHTPRFVGTMIAGDVDLDERCPGSEHTWGPLCGIARAIACCALDQMQLTLDERRGLRKLVNTYDLAWELGMAEERQYSVEHFEDLAERFLRPEDRDRAYLEHLLRKFFVLCRRESPRAARDLDQRLRRVSVRILRSVELISRSQQFVESLHLVDESLIPQSDAWAVAAAISLNCGLFVTRDEGVLRAALSLGLNHFTAFVRPEQIATAVAAARQ